MWNTEDKEWWCKDGVRREVDFVNRIAPSLGLNAKINPEKEQNQYLPDLIVNGKLADLKSQTTPFYTASTAFATERRPYGIAPQFAVTFNRKDYRHYKQYYPDLDIYFWVEWAGTTGYGVTIRPMVGVYKVPFRQLAADIEAEEVSLHEYQRRLSDTRNARNSYGFDVRKFECLIEKFGGDKGLLE